MICIQSRALALVFGLWTFGAVASLANAQPEGRPEDSRVVENPPLLTIIRPAAARAQARAALPEGMPQPTAEAALDLNVAYTSGKIWNPAEQRYDNVNCAATRERASIPTLLMYHPRSPSFPVRRSG
jgi:hypothetical protein